MTSRPRLLLAEDDAMLREILEDGLSSEGFEVVAAPDGLRALELFRDGRSYDLLLLDEEMPGMTGRTLLARLRSEGNTIPALLISGNLELSDDERESLSVPPVLRKPISLVDLADALRKALSA
jgi:CheY-like chemotaxis protein